MQKKDKLRILFVVNPAAGPQKTSVNVKEEILKNLDLHKFEPDFLYTRHPKHASELKSQGLLKMVDVIVAVGGDGTVNEVSKNIVNERIALGIIPTGSGNGLARHLKIPLAFNQAVKHLNRVQPRPIDAARIQDFLFLNVAGVGFDAEVSSKFAHNRKRGFLNYAKLTFSSFFNYQPDTYNINVDGETIQRKAFLIAIANSSQYGNNAAIAPEAEVDDGILNLCVMRPIKWFETPFVTWHMFRTTLHKTKYVEYHRGKNFVIHHNYPYFHFDGEPSETTDPIEINIMPKAIKVLY